jgi:hypothetical protein
MCESCTGAGDESCAVCNYTSELAVFHTENGITTGKCVCKEGYFLKQDGTACIACDQKCASCTSDGSDTPADIQPYCNCALGMEVDSGLCACK